MALCVGGGATAGASQLIDGRRIQRHSIPLDALSSKARRALRGKRGERGPEGQRGATGATGAVGSSGALGGQGTQGPTGGTGSQGPTGAPGAYGPQLIAAAIGVNAREEELISPATGAVVLTGEEAKALVPAPTALTPRSLAVALGVATKSALAFELREHEVVTPLLACTVQPLTTTCADTTPAASVPAGSELYLRVECQPGKCPVPSLTAGISLALEPTP